MYLPLFCLKKQNNNQISKKKSNLKKTDLLNKADFIKPRYQTKNIVLSLPE